MGGQGQNADRVTDEPATPHHEAMTWVLRLKRVFGIEIDRCVRCGGKCKAIASLEASEVIAKSLAHREKAAPEHDQPELPPGPRAPPHRSG